MGEGRATRARRTLSGHRAESLSDRIRTILLEASSDVAVQVDDVPVWRIDDPVFGSRSRMVEVSACRRALLDALAEEPETVYLVHADDPEEVEIPGSWTRANAGTWRWPPDLELDDPVTARWLMAVGSWTAYSAPQAVEILEADPFRTPARKVLARMRDERIDVLVAVLPDGGEWVAALA